MSTSTINIRSTSRYKADSRYKPLETLQSLSANPKSGDLEKTLMMSFELCLFVIRKKDPTALKSYLFTSPKHSIHLSKNKTKTAFAALAS